jgi:hypothetical protein
MTLAEWNPASPETPEHSKIVFNRPRLLARDLVGEEQS